MLVIQGESGYIPVAEYFDLSEKLEVSTIIFRDCFGADLDFSGVRFADGSMGCHGRAMVEDDNSSECTVTNLNYQRDYIHWGWQDWAAARNGVVFRSPANGLLNCTLMGVNFGVRALANQNWAKDLTVQGRATDGLRITGCDFKGEAISIGECYWDTAPDSHDKAEHADGIHVHPLLPPEEQHNGVISGLHLKNVLIHNHQQIAGQRWSHGFQVTDGKLDKSRLENMRIETDNSNGLVIAEAHDLELEDVTVHSPDPNIESQICIGTRKPNYGKSTGVQARRVTSDRLIII